MEAGRSHGTPHSVILVGLHEDDVDTATHVLGGYQVHSVTRLSQLREVLEDLSPSVVLSEVWIQDAYFVEVRELVAESSPGTPMILVVSSFEDDVRALDFASNLSLVLQKPLRRSELVAAVEHAVRLRTVNARMVELEESVARLQRQNEEASRLKSEFLSLVSHELRTPLTEVIGYSELLATGTSPPDKVVEFASHIVRSANQLRALIDDLLTLSKAEAGALPLEVSTFPAAAVLEGKVSSLAEEAKAQGFHVEVKVDERAGLITGDRAKLSKVLFNLLSNAVKFTPPGGTLSIEISDAGPAVLFSVSDTGKGISQEKLRDLFLAFRQEDSSDRRERGGLGIGLSIVKHFVELHGGSVRVSSRPERGTVFSFVIPRRQQRQPMTARRGA